MSLQALWALFLAHPAQAVNGLALFFGVAGAWLLDPLGNIVQLVRNPVDDAC
ncbi:hypothetical protein HKT44_08475, partial [Pseudomonas aeruginosa]|nr:hypothetical protein [Pseudomonas aeruginosa]